MSIRKTWLQLGVIFVCLLLCNIAFFLTSGWSHYAMVVLAIGGLYVICIKAALTSGDLGIERRHVMAGFRFAVVSIGIIFCAMLLLYAFDKQVYRDPRYHQSLVTAFFAALLIEPFKTVIFEEVTFRGILPALLLKTKRSKLYAMIVSSLAFGFWHVTSSYEIGNYHAAASVTVPRISVVIATIIFTSIAGYILCELRFRSKSLVAPFLVHWFVDGMAIILAAYSWRYH